jgi:hypothetical protein
MKKRQEKNKKKLLIFHEDARLFRVIFYKYFQKIYKQIFLTNKTKHIQYV